MRRPLYVLAAALVFVGANGVVVAGQVVPNFSGTWVAIPGASTPKEVKVGPPVTVLQTDTVFTTTHQQPKGARRTYRLDGTETRYEEKESGQARLVTAKATWAGPKLVITEWRGPASKRELIYSLDDAGRLVISSTRDRLGDTAGGLKMLRIATTVVYRKY